MGIGRATAIESPVAERKVAGDRRNAAPTGSIASSSNVPDPEDNR